MLYHRKIIEYFQKGDHILFSSVKIVYFSLKSLGEIESCLKWKVLNESGRLKRLKVTGPEIQNEKKWTVMRNERRRYKKNG